MACPTSCALCLPSSTGVQRLPPLQMTILRTFRNGCNGMPRQSGTLEWFTPEGAECNSVAYMLASTGTCSAELKLQGWSIERSVP